MSVATKDPSPEKQLAALIAKYPPAIAKVMSAARGAMRKRLPSALEVVYEYASSLVIAYGPSEKGYEGVFALSCRDRGVELYFNQAVGLPDPNKLLRGSAKLVRSLPLESAMTLDDPDVRALMKTALEKAKVSIPASGAHRLIIKATAAAKKAGRPGAKRTTPR